MRKKIMYITVCKNTILRNLKNGTKDPPIRVSVGKHGTPTYYHRFRIPAGCLSEIVYLGNGDGEKPLPWGARVWVQVHLTGDTTVETGAPGGKFPRRTVPVFGRERWPTH